MNPQQCKQRPDGVWVCGECGFAYELGPDAVSARLAPAAARVRESMAAIEPARLGQPPRPGIWSPRVYLAHLTDWTEIIAERIDRILHEDRPMMRGFDQDALATEKAYATWDVSDALDRYAVGSDRARALVDEAGPANWDRLGVRDDLGEVSLSLIANDLIHELDHHLLDIQGVAVGEKPE